MQDWMQCLQWSLTSAEQRRVTSPCLLANGDKCSVFFLIGWLYVLRQEVSCLACRTIEGCISEVQKEKVLVPKEKRNGKSFWIFGILKLPFIAVPSVVIVEKLAAFDLPCVCFHISILSMHRKCEQFLEIHFSSNIKTQLVYLPKFLLIWRWSLFTWSFLLQSQAAL